MCTRPSGKRVDRSFQQLTIMQLRTESVPRKGDMLKLMLVAGARPNFMKVASVVDAIDAYNRSHREPLSYLLVHTGQHYGDKMSDAFFRDLGLPKPAVHLGVGSASHALQTAEIMSRFEPILLQERPDAVIVVGDVNSTIACSLVVSKLSYADHPVTGLCRPLLVHVEGGLRSGDRSMPEEVNRVVTDALSDMLFVTEASAVKNLRLEGIPKDKIHFVGNTMVDTLIKFRKKSLDSQILQRLGLQRNGRSPVRYALVTLHRPSNVDDRDTFREILEGLVVIGNQLPVIFPIHPRTVNRIKEFGLEAYCRTLSQSERLDPESRGVIATEPMGYLDFLCLTSNAALVLTDSGGIQEETTALAVPCITLRHNTERPITVTQGTNVLAGTSKTTIVAKALRKLRQDAKAKRPRLWDGRAGHRIVRIVVQQLRRRRTSPRMASLSTESKRTVS